METQSKLEGLFHLFDLKPGASVEEIRRAYLQRTSMKKFDRYIVHLEGLRVEFVRYHEAYVKLMRLMHEVDEKADFSYKSTEEIYRFVFNQGVYEMCRDNFLQASARFTEVFKSRPKDKLLLVYMGALLSRRRSYNTAEKYLREAQQQDPENEDVWFFLGETYLRAGRFPRAIECLEKAQQLNPAHTEIAFMLKQAREQRALKGARGKRPGFLSRLAGLFRDDGGQ